MSICLERPASASYASTHPGRLLGCQGHLPAVGVCQLGDPQAVRQAVDIAVVRLNLAFEAQRDLLWREAEVNERRLTSGSPALASEQLLE